VSIGEIGGGWADRRVIRMGRVLPFLRGRRRLSLISGGALLTAVIAVCLAAPLLASSSPSALHPEIALRAPTTAHVFGTDQFGRDLFARALFAGRVDLLIAFSIVATAFLAGTTIGILAGWVGGWLDAVVMRVIDVALAFPFLVLVICIVGVRGPGLLSLYMAVSAVAWVFYARLVRSEVRVIQQADYMRAARASGFRTPRILVRHLLPNVIIQPLVYASSDCVYALLLGASVSYLGLGVQPPRSEWGQMVYQGTPFLGAQWWISFFPGLAIVLTGIAYSLIGDGLADLAREGADT